MRVFLRRLLPWLILAAGIVLFFWGMRSHSHSWYFQDETEHVAIGWMISQKGSGLYTQLASNHQPLPILFGALLAKILPYNSLFLLIYRLRLVMFAWLAVWGVFLTWRFRWQGMFISLFLSSLSYWYFGWHVLAESLVAPAVAALMLYVGESTKKHWHWHDIAIMAFALFLCTFSLLPLWPFVLLVGSWVLWRLSQVQKKMFLVVGLALTALLFIFISPADWFRETVFNNLRYFIPFEAPADKLGLLLYPFLHLLYPSSPIGRLYWLALPLIGFGLWRFHWPKQGLILLLFWWVLNPRITTPDATFYSGFHLFPYLAGLGTVALYFGSKLWNEKNWKIKGALVGIAIALSLNNSTWVLEKKDRMSEYEIQYGTHQSIANVLNTIKVPGDTLLTGPNGGGYINMLSDLPFADKLNFHLEWAWRVPYLRAEFEVLMSQNPPTFIYFQTGESSSYYNYLEPILAEKYFRLQRTDGRETDLYFRKDAAKHITDKQWEDFQNQYFLKPDDSVVRNAQ